MKQRSASTESPRRSLPSAILEWVAQHLALSSDRYLVREILFVQLMVTALVGIAAVSGLYWGTQWSLGNSYERWARSWAADLTDLGTPLYLPHDTAVARDIGKYVGRYDEISEVTYFDVDGAEILSLGQSSAAPARQLSADERDRLSGALEERRYELQALGDTRRFRIVAPVVTESLGGDGLFAFDPDSDQHETETELIGFVSLELDFGWYYEQLIASVRTAGFALCALLIATWMASRMLLERSIRPLAELTAPIEALGRGDLSVAFQPAPHRELSVVVDAMNNAVSALSERDERLQRLANHDPLTQLYNRPRFTQLLDGELSRVRTGARTAALYFIDCDQFKYVNDSCGYLAGDELLRQIAHELLDIVDERCQVARLGGDEFAVLAPDCNAEDAEVLGHRIVEQMRKLTFVDGETVFYAQCSVGLVLIESGEHRPDELLSRGDLACREAKARGRNRLEVFRTLASADEQLSADIGWTDRLRTALEHDGFVLRYQPIVHILSGKTTHHEVLLRLRDEDGGLVSPEAFLPAARRFGLMSEIEDWVIEHAMADLAAHVRQRPEARFTINLSAAAFESPTLVDCVRNRLDDLGLAASSLVFEITEQMAVRQMRATRSVIEELRALGCGIAIDDFGTGYSSFRQLRELPADYVKIDGGFVRGMQRNEVDRTMVRMIAELGRAAGLKTVAEFVSSDSAVAMLAELGIDYVQGYGVGRPTATPQWKTIAIPLAVGRNASRRESRKDSSA